MTAIITLKNKARAAWKAYKREKDPKVRDELRKEFKLWQAAHHAEENKHK